MANIIGDSGAWKEIAEDIRRRGLHVGKPSDIGPLLIHLRETYQPSVDRKRAETAQRVALNDDRINLLRAEKGFFRVVLNWVRIQGLEITNTQLRSEEAHYIAALSSNIHRLEYLQHSPELAGAQAELNVVAQLEHLSDEHTVFNDIYLHATRYIRFNGTPLQSAQIDHLVLSPSGIFVIETKRWSRNFVESREYHNPFDQIQRAAYLCYDLVREDIAKVRVRGVIATAGHLPSIPEDAYVKVLRVTELDKYISSFRQVELRPAEVLYLHQFFEQYASP